MQFSGVIEPDHHYSNRHFPLGIYLFKVNPVLDYKECNPRHFGNVPYTHTSPCHWSFGLAITLKTGPREMTASSQIRNYCIKDSKLLRATGALKCPTCLPYFIQGSRLLYCFPQIFYFMFNTCKIVFGWFLAPKSMFLQTVYCWEVHFANPEHSAPDSPGLGAWNLFSLQAPLLILASISRSVFKLSFMFRSNGVFLLKIPISESHPGPMNQGPQELENLEFQKM